MLNVQSKITRSALALLVSLVTLTALSSSAWAQSDAEKAKGFYEEGVKAAYAGNYGEAIFQFKQGHKLAPNGLFTYNITIAYLKTKNYEDALRYARETEERQSDLDDSQRSRNMARMSAIVTRRNAINAADDIKESIKNAQANSGSNGGNGNNSNVTDTTKSGRTGIGGIGYTGLGLTVVGSGLMLGSLYFNNQLKSLINEDGMIPAESEAEAVQYRTTGLALLVGGGAVALTGVGMFVYALGSRSSGASANNTSLMLAPARGGGYMNFTVRF